MHSLKLGEVSQVGQEVGEGDDRMWPWWSMVTATLDRKSGKLDTTPSSNQTWPWKSQETMFNHRRLCVAPMQWGCSLGAGEIPPGLRIITPHTSSAYSICWHTKRRRNPWPSMTHLTYQKCLLIPQRWCVHIMILSHKWFKVFWGSPKKSLELLWREYPKTKVLFVNFRGQTSIFRHNQISYCDGHTCIPIISPSTIAISTVNTTGL